MNINNAIMAVTTAPTESGGIRLKYLAIAGGIGPELLIDRRLAERTIAGLQAALKGQTFDSDNVQEPVASGPFVECTHCSGSGRVPTAGKPLPSPEDVYAVRDYDKMTVKELQQLTKDRGYGLMNLQDYKRIELIEALRRGDRNIEG